MYSVSDNVKSVRARIEEAAVKSGRDPRGVSLMAVTKTQPARKVNEAIKAGVTLLGENRAQELLEKYGEYDRGNAEIHFIGSLQTNKARQIADKVRMVQSLDSLRLAEELDRQAKRLGVVMDVLIEVNIGLEESKSGVLPSGVAGFAEEIGRFSGLRLRGIMTIPPVFDKNIENEEFFDRTRQLFVDIQDKIVDNKNIDILSMGMSDDFEPAVKHGSTLVRIGSALFGARA